MPLGVPDGLVGEVGDAALEGLGAEEAHGFLVAGMAEQALAGPESDREDLEPQLGDQVVLDQRVYELEAAGDDDVPVYLLLQRRDLVKHVALEDCRVVPGGMFQGRGHDVLGQAVQPVRQLAAPRWPPRGEPLVAPPAQQEGPGGQRLVERELGKLWAIPDLVTTSPAAAALAAGAGSGSSCAAFRGRPGSRSASARPIPASTAQATKARSEERRVGKECRSRWSPYH